MILQLVIMALFLGLGILLVLSVFSTKKKIIKAVALGCILSAAILLLQPYTVIARIINYSLGILLYAVLSTVPYWAIVFTKPNWKRFAKWGYIALTVLLSIVAIINFHAPITINEFTISANVNDTYRLVHITDTQLGSTSQKHFDKSWQLAFDQNPDFIVFTGDLIDSDYYSSDQFDILKQSPVPIYFSYGNHEFYHNEQKLSNILANINTVHILRSTTEQFEDLSIRGVDYNVPLNQNDSADILLYHEPKYVNQTSSILTLSGHTHGGQLWPLTYVVSSIYKYPSGLYSVGNRTLYVSTGSGLWGPNMRLGTRNEISVFTLIS